MVIVRWFSGVCVISADSCVGAVDDGKCSPWVICDSLCGVKVHVMGEWPLVVSGAKFMAWIRDSINTMVNEYGIHSVYQITVRVKYDYWDHI